MVLTVVAQSRPLSTVLRSLSLESFCSWVLSQLYGTAAAPAAAACKRVPQFDFWWVIKTTPRVYEAMGVCDFCSSHGRFSGPVLLVYQLYLINRGKFITLNINIVSCCTDMESIYKKWKRTYLGSRGVCVRLWFSGRARFEECLLIAYLYRKSGDLHRGGNFAIGVAFRIARHAREGRTLQTSEYI